MAAGRKAQPAALKILNGRGNGRDSGGRAVKPPPAFVRLPPEPPEILDEKAHAEARAVWERVVPELSRLGLVKEIDAEALAAYCLTWERFVLAQRAIDEDGLFATTSQGIGRHPAVAILDAASKDLRAWASEFGLTPSSEGKLAIEGAKGDEDNPFAGGAEATTG